MPRRQAIYVEGFGHKNPIPAACRIGDLVVSGIITGTNPMADQPLGTLDEQCAAMFRNMRRIVEAAGGSTDDIIKVNVWMVDRDQRGPVNREWLAMFPDKASAPARQAMQGQLGPGLLIQCDFMAVLDG